MNKRSSFKQGLTFIVLVVLSLSPISFGVPSKAQSQGPTPQIIESDDPGVTREGTWALQSASGASGGSYLYSSGSPDDILTLEFQGPSIEIVYVSGTALGTLAIEIDGTVLRTVITKDTKTQFGQEAVINYLTDESHTLKAYGQEGSIVGIDALVGNFSKDSQESDTFPYSNPLSRDIESPAHLC